MIRRTVLSTLSIITAISLALTASLPVSALDGSQFNAGRIIDDSVFNNSSSMSVAQIQQFLNSKVTCDTWGVKTSELGGGTRAQYGAAHGNPAPFTCLPGYYENPTTHDNNLDGRAIPSGAMSAAQIISDAATRYGINPQVLIVLLQKEQGLVTDEWPFDVQYRSATGYGCPDTAACNASYYGLYNQVEDAAWQFQHYAQNPTAFNFWPYSYNNISWSPSASCGSSSVYIQNQATASLYDYTPYQPNAAALNNLYGSGDSCSSYGNRNFWRYFNDWFGSTTGVRFASTFAGWSAYPTIQAGGTATGWFFFKNTGTSIWHDATTWDGGLPPIALAATNPINRSSRFSATWPSPSRAAINFTAVYESDGVTLASNQHVVNPGQMGVFSFTFTAPIDTPPGVYREWFQPVAEGAPDWQLGSVGYLDVTVTPADYRAQFYRQSANLTLSRGDSAPVVVDYKNVGAQPWYDDVSVPTGQLAVHLADTNPINRLNDLHGFDWPNRIRPSQVFAAVYEADGKTLAANQHIAYPGQIARWYYNYTVPLGEPPATYTEWVQPIHDNAPIWDMGDMSYFTVTVAQPRSDYQARFYRFSGYPTVSRGNSTTVSIDYANVGTQAWHDNTVGDQFAINLANTNPINRSNSLLKGNDWASASRPAAHFAAVYESDGTTLAADQHVANPGQIVRFNYTYSAPSNMIPGTYREWIQPVHEWTSQWDIGALGYFDVTVQ